MNEAKRNEESSLTELLCCPFCGTAAKFIHRGSNNKLDNNWTIGCETDTCFIGSEGADWYLPQPLAAKWWNTRAT